MKPRLFVRDQAEEAVLAEPASPRTFTPPRVEPKQAARSAPLPHRPKGRLLVLGVLLLVLGTVSLSAWDAFLRYDAYGTVTGRVVDVSPPWSGTVEALYVRPGDELKQGDEIASLGNPDIDAAVDRLTDELRVARAELEAEIGRVALEARHEDDRRQKALADYYALAAELLAERSRYDDLESKLTRANELMERNALAGQEFDSARFAEMGQRSKVEQLQQAVAELQRRAEAAERPIDEAQRLEPKLARIEQIQAEIQRLREKRIRGTVRAPVDGRVLAVHRQVGEYLEESGSIVELLCEGSLEVLIYARQESADAYTIGAPVEVIVRPNARPLPCRVVRIGDEYQEAPRSLETRYGHGERLLPVYLVPAAGHPSATALRLGGEVRVPWNWHVL